MKDYAGTGRSLRKKRKTYIDGMDSGDEDAENIERTLDPEDIVKSKDYPSYFVTTMKGEDVTLEHFQRTGFKTPILVPEKSGLHMRVPDSSFSITDVRNLVGGKRILEVMNSATQSNAEMTLKDWEEFFTDPDRDGTKLNVISLEFSHTKLDSHVVAPRVVRQIDFTDNVWPRHFKEQQEDGSNDMAKMLYPKVQKYCLMSIAGCYTDFHVDLGGTSVWYHVLKGKKVFWLIPPNQANLKAFEQWTMSGKQSDVFFGDLVDKCGKVELLPGNTFFIPSGWIHGVYTPVDSLVFGGNYLHSFAIERQLKIAQIEETLKVPHKYRFPFFTDMMWFTLDKYCYALLGRHHLNFEDNILTRLLGTEEERKVFVENIGHPYVTPEEVRGLKSIVLYLHSLPSNKKGVPSNIKDPVSLIRDIRTIVEVHKNDTQEKAVNGRPLIYWPGLKNDVASFCFPSKKSKPKERFAAPRVVLEGQATRRLRADLVCELCGLDGWWADPQLAGVERNPVECGLMECVACRVLAHPSCLPEIGVDGRSEQGGEDSNCWTCPTCVQSPPRQSCAETPEETPVKAEVFNDFDGTAASIKEEAMETEEAPPAKQREEPTVPESKVFAIIERICASSEKVRAAKDLYQAGTPLAEAPLLVQPCLQLLPSPLQAVCRAVCRSWAACLPPTPSSCVDLQGSTLSSHSLAAVARLQPQLLHLGHTNITKQHLAWLLPKLPSTRLLSLAALDFQLSVSALTSPSCPTLSCLDLRAVSGLQDSAVSALLRSRDTKRSNLANLRSLNLSSTDITDVSLRYIAQFLPSLCRLVLSSCSKLTDAGLVQLGDASLPLCSSLLTLDLSSCPGVTELVPLASCSSVCRINLLHSGVGPEAVQKYLESRGPGAEQLRLYQGQVLAPVV